MDDIAAERGREEEGDAGAPQEDTSADSVAEDARLAGLDVGIERLEGDVRMTVVAGNAPAGVESRAPAPGLAGAEVEDAIEKTDEGSGNVDPV